MLQNLRLAMSRQIRRHSTRRSTASRRRLGRLWSRLFGSEGRARGHAPLLDSPDPTQISLGLHGYRTVGEPGSQARRTAGDEVDVGGTVSSCCSATTDLHGCMLESPASPLSYEMDDSPEEEEEEEEQSPVSRESSRAPQSDSLTPDPSDSSTNSQPPSVPLGRPRASRKLVLELAANLKGVSLRRYSPLGPLSPISPPVFPSNSQTLIGYPHYQGILPPGASSSPGKAEDSNCTAEIRSVLERRREDKGGFCRTLSDEAGASGRETTPC